MALISTVDRNKLFLHIKHELGYPLRPFELTDEMMISYLEMVVEDYSSMVNNWLIQQQWVALEGMDRNTGDFLSAFTTKSNHYMESFTYAYSKQVGLGANAPAQNGWELKQDYIVCSAHTQHYIIPKNREINSVLWENPPAIDSGLVDPMYMTPFSAGMMGLSTFSRQGMVTQPIYSTLLGAQDRRMKQKVLQSTLSYRITGLATGEKVLHLYPIPGDRNEIAGRWGKHFSGTKVFYFYYDTNSENRDKCLEENSDIIRLPSSVPSEVLEWDKMNDVAKQQIRNFLVAKVKLVIGSVRGFYTGNVASSQNQQLVLDYRHLLDEGAKLKEETEKMLLDQLEKLRRINLTEENMKIAENVNGFLGKQPFSFPIVTM